MADAREQQQTNVAAAAKNTEDAVGDRGGGRVTEEVEVGNTFRCRQEKVAPYLL